tara:strand:+ start:193 stop:879 length:687 start_codon:yes stop_codon:yes gene_type:complete
MSNYFRKIPNFDYVSRLPDAKISDYIRVKNFFKRVKLREDIFQDLTFFEKYSIEGDDRPDNVAFKVYEDSTYDWVILISNNIINIQSEWPIPQNDFDRFLLDKYETYDNLYGGIHHYETMEIKNSEGVTIVPAKLNVPENYSVSYYDYLLDQQVQLGSQLNGPIITNPITNYEYEESLNNQKRIIFVLKPFYLSVIVNDIENTLLYKEGSSQYISEDLVRGDNIRIYS